MKSILVVDCDLEWFETLREGLECEGIRLTQCRDAMSGLCAGLSGEYDLMLLNVAAPAMKGADFLRKLRLRSRMHVIAVSTKDDIDELVASLESGADGYIRKSVVPREMIARIRAMLRRTSEKERRSSEAVCSGFTFHERSRTASYDGYPLTLTPVEYRLLKTLVENPDVVLPREYLVQSVLRRTYHPMDRGLDMLVSRLRRKLDIVGNPGARVKTARSAGYFFATQE